MKITASTCLLRIYYAIIVWVNNFQTPKILAVLSSFFRDSNDIARGSNRGGGWLVGM